MSDANPFAPVMRKLLPHDPVDTLQLAAALQLLPENADHALSLELIAHIATSLPLGARLSSTSAAQLRALCRDFPVLSMGNDPSQQPFTQAITFVGGSYIIYPGLDVEAIFMTNHLIQALFQLRTPFPDQVFVSASRELFIAVLALSQEVAHRAGHQRGMHVITSSQIALSTPKRLRQLRHAVTFSTHELKAVLQKAHVSDDCLDPLVCDLGTATISPTTPDAGELLSTPIVRARGTYVVAIPSMLLAAARSFILQAASLGQYLTEIQQRYSLCVWGTITTALERCQNRQLRVPLPPPPPLTGFHEGVFALDADKLIYVALMTEPIDRAADITLPDALEVRSVELQTRVQEVAHAIQSRMPDLQTVLCLAVVQGVTAQNALMIPAVSQGTHLLTLGMTAADLDIISWHAYGEPLELLTFARSLNRLQQHTRVMAFSLLDLFATYIERDHAFYFTDALPPEVLICDITSGRILRERLIKHRDFHGARSDQPQFIVEVTTLYNDRAVPIYAAPVDIGQRTRLLVEGLPAPIWIVVPDHTGRTDERIHMLRQLVTATAYWLWQFTPALQDMLASMKSLRYPLVVSIDMTDDDDTAIALQDQVDYRDSSFTDISEMTSRSLTLTVHAALIPLLRRADNLGERALIYAVLRGLRTLLPASEQPRWYDGVLTSLVERYAPLGQQKMILLLSTSDSPQLDPQEIPEYREMDPAFEDHLRDEIGDFLINHLHYPVGPIAPMQRTEALKRAVGYCYQQLEDLVGTLDPDGLLEWLVAHHEAVIHESATHRLTLPTRLACFGKHMDFIAEVSQEFTKLTKAAIAHRFLIEYVTARAPSGSQMMTREIHAQLLALATLIFNLAFESDIIHFSLADIPLDVLPSGRLGTDREAFEHARNAYLPILASGEIGRAQRGFPRHWREHHHTDPPSDEIQQMDAAMTAECGFSLTELGRLCGDIIAFSQHDQPGVSRCPESDLIAWCQPRLGWAYKRIQDGLRLLELTPRADFLAPPEPFVSTDVYPWRFNRTLSYLRRPLLVREPDGNRELVWGPRQVAMSADYLMMLCIEGRFHGTSALMKTMMGLMCNQMGKEFNQQVAHTIRQYPQLIVREQVKKIGSQRIRGPHGDLGDIDVLVADTVHRCLWIMECKSLALARTPHELAQEITAFFVGSRGKKAILTHHQERLTWMQVHLQEALAWLGISIREGWEMRSLIIVDRELMTPFLRQPPVPILAYAQFQSWCETQWCREG